MRISERLRCNPSFVMRTGVLGKFFAASFLFFFIKGLVWIAVLLFMWLRVF